MQLSQLPNKISVAFASGGGKNAIPVPSQIGTTAGAASYTDGFPPLTRTPLAAGGVPPSGTDMNGVLFDMSSISRWLCGGGKFSYDASFSTAVGGYPLGAGLMTANGNRWRNMVENNATNPEGGTNWIAEAGSFQSALVLTAARILTSADVGKIVIPSLTGPYNITLPLVNSVLAGSSFNFLNVCPQTVTIFTQGGDSLNAANSTVPSIPLASGETLQISTEGNGWYVIGGSASLKYSTSSFGSLLASGGSYIRHPSGLIEQFGSIITNASGLATIAYPIPFPTAALSGTLSVASAGAYYGAEWDSDLGLVNTPIRLNSAISLRVYYNVKGY